MKKITILSIVAAAMIFTGCGEDSKKAVSEASAKAVESTKEAAKSMADAAKVTADIAVEKAQEAEKAAKAAASKAVEATKEAATATKEAAKKVLKEASVDKAINAEGKKLYAKCAGCHGVDGKTKALGKSPVIAGQDKAELSTNLKAYKAGTRNINGMGALMKGQMATLDDAMITEVAAYISTLK